MKNSTDNKATSKPRKHSGLLRIAFIVIVQILLMATAWTVCVIAPMPWKIIIPVTLGALSILIHACTYFSIARSKNKKKRR